MGELLFDSLEIRNFRLFRHLQIERLGRVNLLVGRNNTGKTAVLEALQLYANRDHLSVMRRILEARDEINQATSRLSAEDFEQSPIKYLFHGRKDITEIPDQIQIKSLTDLDNALYISLDWYIAFEDEGNALREWKLLLPEEHSLADNPILRFTFQIGNQPRYSRPIDLSIRRTSLRTPQNINHVFISTLGIDKYHLGHLWDSIAITDLEQNILSALQIVAPEVERFTVIGDREIRSAAGYRLERVPAVRIEGSGDRIPLKSLGEGINRMLGIALALVNAKDGLLLVDEIESGLHYSVQYDMWRLVFETARRLNVQVFATTHSDDCTRAFQKASKAHAEEGMLIRLGRRQGDIVATLFDEEELETAVEQDVEVR
jgi:ABC-type dipeptide/oligopeptide/nickel transport system ATPase component